MTINIDGEKVLDFLVLYVIVRGIIVPMLAGWFKKFFLMPLKKLLLDPIIRYFCKRFIRGEKDLIIWMHWLNKGMNQNHKHSMYKCTDEKCALA